MTFSPVILAGRTARALLVSSLALVAIACNTPQTGQVPFDAKNKPVDVDLAGQSYNATELLLQNTQQTLDMNRPILVASLVNVANLERSSNLGRVVSEQVSSRLSQLGYDTRETKLRGSFLIKEGAGEFALSREIKAISAKQNAQAVIAGVYAVARSNVMVTLRLIRAKDGKILSAVDYTLPMGPDTAALLGPYDIVQYRQ